MERRKIFRRVLTLVLAAALMLPLAPSVTVEAQAVTQAEIDALKKDAANLASQQKDIRNKLTQVRAEKGKLMDQKAALEDNIELTRQQIANIQSQIEMYTQLIAQKEEELAAAEADEAELYDLFCQRVREMEEGGEASYWSILFASDSFSDLLDNFMMIEEFIEYDNGLMEEILALQEQIKTDKAALEQSKAEEEAAKAEQQAFEQDLKAQEAEIDVLVKDISAQEDELEAAEAELKKAAAAADAEIKKKERELADQIAKVPSESGFLWPLAASYNTLSSLFGSRTDPFTGKPGNHTGIDIPAPKNTPIYAAKSGVVSVSEKGSGSAWSYGNYVVISHSDGTSTLYAHMNTRNVKEGQTVKQGDVVGYVGLTGRTTGYHLHFEVRLNGTRVDPVNYFKDKTLYATSKGVKKILEVA